MLGAMLTRSTRTVASRLAATATALLLVCSLGVVVVAAAGASTPHAKGPSVTIKNLAFSPKTLKVKAGAKITVKNNDGTAHTFTADKGAFDTGDIDGGSSATVTVKKPGTYAYHCSIHNFMKGTIKAT
jgi:plastocyanin